MRLKSGVSLKNVKPSVVAAMFVVDGIYRREFGHEVTVTRVCDSDPLQSPKSLHPSGYAFDVRTWRDDWGTQMHEDIKAGLKASIEGELGSGWDVIVYSTHIHIEHDEMKGQA